MYNTYQKLTSLLYSYADKPNTLARMLLNNDCLSEEFVKKLKYEKTEISNESLGDVSTFAQLERMMQENLFKAQSVEVKTDMSIVKSNLQKELDKLIIGEKYEDAEWLKKHINHLRNK